MAYEVIQRLGRGGMGVVDLAVGPEGAPVALKRLPLHGSTVEMARARARIRREAAVLASLQHPAIVGLLDVVDDGDDVVLVMPYLSGGTLQDRVSTGGHLPAADVVVIADRLLDALAAAHRQGVVHRDIKPANVLFDAAGVAHLADFGVASTRDHTLGLTATEMVVGTPGFMAPEQARGEEATAASDVFSLGATLLYAATGAGPFGPMHADPRVLMWRAAQGKVDRVPRTLPPELRARLAPLLDRRASRRPSAAHVRGGPAGTWAMPARRASVDLRRVASAAVVVALVVLAVAAVVAVLAEGVESPARAGRADDERRPATTSATTTVPCTALTYQPCGPDGLQPPAPFTDGRHCIEGHDDYDADRANGCEAAPDGVPETTQLRGSLRANLVPGTDVDTWALPVSDRFQLFCDGTFQVTLTAPAGTQMALDVLDGGAQLARATSADGVPDTARVTDPDCFSNDSATLTARVTAIGRARSAASYTLQVRGSF